MKQFTTAVCLSERQAAGLVSAIYTYHHQYNGDPGSQDNSHLAYMHTLLVSMMMLPVGSVITMDSAVKRAKGASGYVEFNWTHKGKYQWFKVYRIETNTAKDLAFLFLNAKSFGHLKYMLDRQYGYSFATGRITHNEPAVPQSSWDWEREDAI